MKLIVTGGTLLMVRNGQGLLEPSKNPDAALRNLGFDLPPAKVPCNIDSLIFDIHEHYPKLLEAVLEAIKTDREILIIGGTDTLEYYGTLLAKDVERRGVFDNGVKIAFLSSMRALSDKPDHVKAIMEKALASFATLSPGAWSLAAEDEDVSRLNIHDMRGSFVKISSQLAHAFRSEPSAAPFIKESASVLSAVAPPLIAGNTMQAAAYYLSLHSEKAVIMEYTSGMNAFQKDVLERIEERTARHIPTYIVNDQRYDPKQECFVFTTTPEEWQASEFLRQAKERGAMLTQAPIISVYIDVLLEPLKQKQALQKALKPVEPPKQIGLHYIPDLLSFSQSVALLDEVKYLVITALPGGVISSPYIPLLKERDDKGSFTIIGTKYAGYRYFVAGESRIEGLGENQYAQARDFPGLLRSGAVPPEAILRQLGQLS